jgi:hypothetical protein
MVGWNVGGVRMRKWRRILAVVTGIAATGAVLMPAMARDTKSEIAELGEMLRIKPNYPVPAEPNQIFYIERSLNPNTVVYVANLDASGKLDPKEPVKAYWRRYNRGGYVKQLSLPERMLAYGVASVKRDGPNGAYSLTIAALPERKIYVGLNDKGHPEAFAKVGSRWARLVYVYLEVDDSGFLPDVSAMDLFGYDKATGKPLREHLTER